MVGDQTLTVHATCVALCDRGVLITGPSGSGKSGLALGLMALGMSLVSDDRTVLTLQHGTLMAAPPEAISGMIEARGVGILSVPHLAQAPIVLAIDLAQREQERLPLRHSMALLDITLPCLHKVDAPYFPAAIHTYLKCITREA